MKPLIFMDKVHQLGVYNHRSSRCLWSVSIVKSLCGWLRGDGATFAEAQSAKKDGALLGRANTGGGRQADFTT